jgi:hypothetical protein
MQNEKIYKLTRKKQKMFLVFSGKVGNGFEHGIPR